MNSQDAGGNAQAVMKIGASEGIRTLDILVGNEMLYQTELRSRSEEQA